MKPPELITFDCAQTLLDVKWHPGKFAMACADHCGLRLEPAAEDRFSNLFGKRQQRYLELNQTRDKELGQEFWDRLTFDWLKAEGVDAEFWTRHLKAASKYLGFGTKSTVFKVYDDVVPCLVKLKKANIKTAVISNWDFSLHGILEVMRIRHYFDFVFASLEEGFEKPDPRIFRLALDAAGAEANHSYHIGDDPIDDLQGARNVGMKAILVDRELPAPMAPPYIRSLSELYGALRWQD